MLRIKKRDGRIVPFDREKIINAINKALIEVDGKLYEEDTAQDIAAEIEEKVEDEKTGVENIQDMVEEALMRSERKDVAKAYIRYRYKQEVARNGLKEFLKSFDQKIRGSNIENQNANVDEMSFGGRYGSAADLAMKEYALNFCMSDMMKNNHLNNEIYVHKLNCA